MNQDFTLILRGQLFTRPQNFGRNVRRTFDEIYCRTQPSMIKELFSYNFYVILKLNIRNFMFSLVEITFLAKSLW